MNRLVVVFFAFALTGCIEIDKDDESLAIEKDSLDSPSEEESNQDPLDSEPEPTPNEVPDTDPEPVVVVPDNDSGSDSDPDGSIDDPVIDPSPDPVVKGDIRLRWQVAYADINDDVLYPFEIESFSINWGPTENDMSNSVDWISPDSTEYLIEDIETGSYAFSISVNTIYGDRSELSDVVYGVVE